MVKTLPSTIAGSGSIPGEKTKILHVEQPKRIEKQKPSGKKINKIKQNKKPKLGDITKL